jgi:RNA polymerase sigma-70 factor (ECF subfamily)
MEPDKITELYKKYGFMILGRCQHLLGSEDEAKDAMQVVFMQLLKHYDSIRDKAQVVPWIFNTARNHCFNVLRSRKRFIDGIPVEDIEYIDTFEERMGRKQLITLIMNQMDKNVRDAVYYTYIEELDQKDIQKLIGQSPATIRRNLKRFKDALPQARKALGL